MIESRQQDGFTLVELLVCVVLLLIVFAAVLNVFDVFQRDNRIGQLRNETQDNARNTLDRLARELRNVAAPSTKAAGALETAEAYSVTFETIDPTKTSSGSNATNAMRVRYCLDDSKPENEILWRQTKRWESAEAPAAPSSTACPDTNGSHWDKTGPGSNATRLVEHVVNRIGGKTTRSVFAYSPAAWTSVSQIIGVEPTLYLDPAPRSRPGETQLTSAISLRNENRPPTASFSAVQLGASRIVSLNASESADPDGLALTYAWWDNGKQQTATSQSWETAALFASSSHTFKLEVTDPGGLSSTTERTVVVK